MRLVYFISASLLAACSEPAPPKAAARAERRLLPGIRRHRAAARLQAAEADRPGARRPEALLLARDLRRRRAHRLARDLRPADVPAVAAQPDLRRQGRWEKQRAGKAPARAGERLQAGEDLLARRAGHRLQVAERDAPSFGRARVLVAAVGDGERRDAGLLAVVLEEDGDQRQQTSRCSRRSGGRRNWSPGGASCAPCSPRAPRSARAAWRRGCPGRRSAMTRPAHRARRSASPGRSRSPRSWSAAGPCTPPARRARRARGCGRSVRRPAHCA